MLGIFNYHCELLMFILAYENGGGVECPNHQKPDDFIEGQDFCSVDLSEISVECSNKTGYGYFEGTPCVLLKLNKVRLCCIVLIGIKYIS